MNLEKIFGQYAASEATKSDILKSLTSFCFLLILGIVALAYVKADTVVIYLLVGLLFLVIGIALIFFVICYFYNPDLLRSESYSLRKMAIEKGYGDSLNGIVEIRNNSNSLVQRKETPYEESQDNG